MTKWLEAYEHLFLRIRSKLSKHIKLLRVAFWFVPALLAVHAFLSSEQLMNIATTVMPGSDETAGDMANGVRPLFAFALLLIVVILLGQLLYLIGDLLFVREETAPPPDREVKLIGRPLTEYKRVATLTRLAIKWFAEGNTQDTMREEVVQAAIDSGSAFGLGFQDEKGVDVGFFDFYHPTKEIMNRWIEGEIAEGAMQTQHFEPMAAAAKRGERQIELFVGAMLLKTGYTRYDYHCYPLLVSAARQYVRWYLRDFDTVVLYASIFTPLGKRYADIEGMTVYRAKSDRGKFGKSYDVCRACFNPREPIRQYFTVALDTTYRLDCVE